MNGKLSDVAYMKEYLKYAFTFETYVYIWSCALNTVNNQLRTVYENEKKLEKTKTETAESLSTVDARYELQRKNKEKELNKNKKSAEIALRILLIDSIVCVVIGGIYFIAGLGHTTTQENYIPKLLLASAAITVASFLVTLAGPICIRVYISKKSKYKEALDELQNAVDGSKRRKTLLLQNEHQQAEKKQRVNKIAEIILAKRQQEITSSLQQAKEQLNKIYAENILPVKYRNLNATSTLYEYLATGRCNTIQGHGGIFDTYEVDLQRGIIIQSLVDIKKSLCRIEENQQVLYHQLEQANRTLTDIRASLLDIQEKNEKIAENAAISAAASQQSAAVDSWFAWNAWAKGL